jgi:hypothetical protein
MFMMMNLLATIFRSRQVVKLVYAVFVADMKVAIFVSLSKVTLCKVTSGHLPF